MTSRTVAATGRLRPSSAQKAARVVFVGAPITVNPGTAGRAVAALEQLIDRDDQIVTHRSAMAVIDWAAQRDQPAAIAEDSDIVPDLVVILVDPHADPAAIVSARALIPDGQYDLLYTELTPLTT